MRHYGTALVALGLVIVASGCSASSAEDEEAAGEATTEAFSRATTEFDDILADVAAVQDRCVVAGKCTGGTSTASIHPTGLPRPDLRRIRLCDALGPLANLESPYFFAGVSAKAALVKTMTDAGVDMVFDLLNQQAALFLYRNHGYQNLVGAEVTAYAGYGFGRKANVLDAWSGDFQTGEATVEVPFLKIAAGGFIFRSPDNSVWGGAAEASFGFNALGPIGTVEVAASEGFWTPWDSATRALGKTFFLVSYEARSAPVGDKRHVYLQFRGARDTALALVERLGPLGAIPAAQAVGLAALRKAELTIERACPKR